MPKGTQGQHCARPVLHETETSVSIQMEPESVCYLSHPSVTDQRVQLDADDLGIVRFHARAGRGADPISLELECLDKQGCRTVHTIALSCHDCPSPAAEPHQPTAGAAGDLIVALEGDPMALGREELLARGYPPRPDPATAPTRYARWLRCVSQPFTAVNRRKVPHPGVSFGRGQAPTEIFSPTLPLPPPVARAAFNSTSNNWSGAYLTNPPTQYSHIQADWPVPAVVGQPGSPFYSAAAEWIGLDNSGTDLFQAGTDSECLNVFGWTLTNYWMWIETLPFAPWGLPNFPLAPGDDVSVDIFVADENGMTWYQDDREGGLTPRDNSVWFMIYNHTRRLSYWGTLPTSGQTLGGFSSSGFTGSTAEFIVERPADGNGNAVPLANFGAALMDNCWYGDALYGDRAWELGQNGSTPFVGNLTYLTMQNSTNGQQLATPLSIGDPGSTGGYWILWLWDNYS